MITELVCVYLNSRMIPSEEKQTCIYTLTADKALPEDNGVWKCEVANSHGVTSAICTVKVLGKLSNLIFIARMFTSMAYKHR